MVEKLIELLRDEMYHGGYDYWEYSLTADGNTVELINEGVETMFIVSGDSVKAFVNGVRIEKLENLYGIVFVDALEDAGFKI
jgi:hypothetical protein